MGIFCVIYQKTQHNEGELCFFLPLILTEATMGCIKSKEGKGPAMKYRTENAPEPVISHVSHYGSDSSQATQSPSIKGSAVNFNSHSMTPFGGPSGMTPFGGASSSFSAVPSTYPSTLTGECYIKWWYYLLL